VIKVDAIHVNWTKPFFTHSLGQYEAEDFEILTTVLSALTWRKHNGSIKMITDSVGARYYKENGMEELWDGGVYDDLSEIDTDPAMFWAAGKLFALRKQKAPVAVIDTDFIVWDEILFDNLPDVSVIHFEDLYPDVYPYKDYFRMNEEYSFDDEWDWSKKACNTAFYVIKNNDFLKYYTDEAIRFMRSAKLGGDTLRYMVFAEQRLFSMCAEKMGLDVMGFSNLGRLFAHGENYFTHTWGMKQQMRDMPELRYDFCMRCINRIRNEFGEFYENLKNIGALKKYF
jgi:hypothetical protein